MTRKPRGVQKTYRLYSRPSLAEGIARIVDFAGTLNSYNMSSSENEADARAIRSDWENVGNDIRKATSQFDKEHARQ